MTDTNTPLDLAGSTLDVDHNVVSSTGLAGGTPLAYGAPGHGANVDTISDAIPSLRQAPIVWALGAGTGAAYGDVGLGRNDGTTLPNNVGGYDQSRKSRNVLALLKGTLGRLVPTTADTSGQDLDLQGGLGTGTAGGGAVSLRASAAGGVSNATPNDAAERLRAGYDGVRFQMYTKNGAPIAADLPSGMCAVYKDSGGGSAKLWVNDAGTLKSVTLA